MLLHRSGDRILPRWLLPNCRRSWLHTVCAVMTSEFLEFSAARGNDLINPRPEMGFTGLGEGDRWCLCVSRWKEALDAGVAPPVILEATHASAVEFVSLKI